MTPFIDALGWTLLHFVWQGFLIGSVTALALALLRNGSARQRYTVGCVALLLCLGWPALNLYRMVTAGDAALAPALVDAVQAQQLAGSSLMSQLQQHLNWIVGAWSLCTALMALRLALGFAWLGRSRMLPSDPAWQARLNSMATRCGITRPIMLRIAADIAGPVTAGFWRPMVLVPAALLSGMPAQLLEALLAHELAHIRRHDYLVNLLQNAIEALLFYHPAVWWISRHVRHERELIADAIAASQLVAPRQLAQALSELERLRYATPAFAQAASGGDLVQRIQQLLRPRPLALGWKAALPMLGLVAGCLSVYSQASQAESNAALVPATVRFNTCIKPQYPASSIRDKEAGSVTLAFDIGTDGKLLDGKVEQSSGHPALDEAALSAIRLCTFKPATRNGQAVSSWTKVMYVWTLD